MHGSSAKHSPKLITTSEYTVHVTFCAMLRGLLTLAFIHHLAVSAAEVGPLTVYAAGDTTGSGMAADDPLRLIRDLLGQADVFLFNHEGTLIAPAAADRWCAPFGRQSVFHSPPAFADHLQLGRQNVAVLANNHILDCGPDGVEGTISALRARGFGTVGAGANAGQACEPHIVEAHGERIGVLAYHAHAAERFALQQSSPGAATWEGCDGDAQVRALADSADLVIVSLHLHLNRSWTELAPQEHVGLAREVLAAGADVVIGHGPHVPQGVLTSGHGIALLSLGNFIFNPGYEMVDGASRSVVARITVATETITADLLPFRLDQSGVPTAPLPDDARRITFDLMRLSSQLGTHLATTSEGARIVVPRRADFRADSP